MGRTRRRAAGYSTVELMIIVAMLGVVMAVTIPAFVTIMPQYRIRGAASETMSSLRAARQMAVTSRRPWRVTFVHGEPPAGGYFYYSRLINNNADMTNPASWQTMGRDMKPLGARPFGSAILRMPAVTLEVATDSPLHDVDCDENVDLIFLRNGTVSDLHFCEGDPVDDVLTFDPPPTIQYTVDNDWVRFNTYTLAFQQQGTVTVTSSKE